MGATVILKGNHYGSGVLVVSNFSVNNVANGLANSTKWDVRHQRVTMRNLWFLSIFIVVLPGSAPILLVDALL
jgi:hypothetical protein